MSLSFRRDRESSLPVIVERLEVSRLDVPHFLAAETVEREVEGGAPTWVLVLNE